MIEQMTTREDIAKLMSLVDKVLKGREKDIILMRYGLLTDREITQREIGKMLGISRSYVSRIEKKALHKLRQAFEQMG